MRNQVWDSTTAQLHSLDLSQLVFGLGALNAVDCEATFGIVDQTEVFASFLDREHVHEACRVCGIGSNFSIDLDQALHDDLLDLAAIEGILEAVADEDDEGEAIAELVRTR